jgi:hypothetical protein
MALMGKNIKIFDYNISLLHELASILLLLHPITGIAIISRYETQKINEKNRFALNGIAHLQRHRRPQHVESITDLSQMNIPSSFFLNRRQTAKGNKTINRHDGQTDNE